MWVLFKIANNKAWLTVTIVATMLACASVYGLAENVPLGEALWWAIVTACTVGYGDSYPLTLVGRLSAATLMLTTVFIYLPLITANILNSLIINQNEFTHSEQERIKVLLEDISEDVDH